MTGDKEEKLAALISPIVRKSKIFRASSIRETSDNLPKVVTEGMYFLDDQEALAVGRIALLKHLDFPHALRGGSIDGILPFGASVDQSAIGSFLTSVPDGRVFVFLEPWLLRGASVVSAKLLASNLWEILESCDHSLKVYDLSISKSCILSADEDEEELRFSVTR